jgi:glutamyl-tRNA synthetase
MLHVGNARIALINYIYAQKLGVQYILRFDDTDSERSLPKYKDGIQADLTWLGVGFDRVSQQSDRDYTNAIELLKGCGLLYPCYETPEELERQRKIQSMQGLPPRYKPTQNPDKTRAPHWRFKLTQGMEVWEDEIFGRQEHAAHQFSDPILVREDGVVLYTLASVADDVADKISMIARGADHISNTVVQRQIFRALGCDPDTMRWAHIPLLVGKNGKLSKRELSEGSIASLRYRGISSEAVVHSVLSVGLKSELQYHRSITELVGADLKYGVAMSSWSADDCTRWERVYRHGLSDKQGVCLVEQLIGVRIPELCWAVIRDVPESELVYWCSVLLDNRLWFKPQYEYEACARKVALEVGCDVDIITNHPLLAGYTKADVGAALRYALSGKTQGPGVGQLVAAMSSELVSARLSMRE